MPQHGPKGDRHNRKKLGPAAKSNTRKKGSRGGKSGTRAGKKGSARGEESRNFGNFSDKKKDKSKRNKARFKN